MEIPNLKVLTLNCWGIRYLSKDISYRYKELCKVLLNDQYDIVALQEVWSQNDYFKLKSKLKPKYSYSHYYYSGCIGSGLAVFSRLPIIDVLQNRFSLNGSAYKLQHGDWLGGKCIGLAKVKYYQKIINVYITHVK
jgi:sphingomyelin phosphodiesterase 2